MVYWRKTFEDDLGGLKFEDAKDKSLPRFIGILSLLHQICSSSHKNTSQKLQKFDESFILVKLFVRYPFSLLLVGLILIICRKIASENQQFFGDMVKRDVRNPKIDML